MFNDLDREISLLSEALARKLSRRRMIVNAVKGLFATVAGVTIAQLINMKSALATTYCDGTGCADYQLTCPGGIGCPSSCTVCINTDCQNGCPHASGHWTVTGLGPCKAGVVYCTDCKCPDCSVKCLCESSCVCCNCCTPQDVEVEIRRLAAAGVR